MTRRPHLDETSGKRITTFERLRLEVEQLATDASLDSWESFIEHMELPGEFVPAMMTMRPDLLVLVGKRTEPMSAADANKLIECIRVLMATNIALKQHAEQVSHLVGNWMNSFKSAHSVAEQISMFANFRHRDVTTQEEA